MGSKAKRNPIPAVLIFMCLALFLLYACKSDSSTRKVPRVENGNLDLRGWNLKKDGPVALNGEWEFYWHAHLKPEEFSGNKHPAISGYIRVPGTWNDFKLNGEKLPGEGYATYRMHLHLAQTGRILAFKILDMAVAFKMYVNGELLLSNGIPAKTSQRTVPQFHPRVVEFDPDSERVEVIVLVSNFHHRKGGAWEPILLGTSADIWQIRQKELNINFFLIGGILMMGLYHIGLFMFRSKEKSNLFFGIFCVLIVLRALVTGERYLIEIFPDFNWEVHTKIAYLTYYAGVPVFGMYFRYIFPREFSRYVVYTVNIIGGIFSAVVVFTPARIYTQTLPLFQIFTVAAACYAFYILILALKHKLLGALICLAGFIVLFLTIVNDILYSNLAIQTGYMIQFGFFIFIFTQATLLSQRFSKAFAVVELQHRELEETNAAYMNEIDERRKLNDELSQYAYAVTHDLKAPLRAVNNYAGFIYEDLAGTLTGEQKDYLMGMKRAITQGDAMINDLLRFSRLNYVPPEKEAIDMPGLVREISAMIGLAPDVKIDIQPQWPEFSADRNLLKQILQNLIVNGIKFNVRSPKRIEIGWREARDNRIEIFVRDNGIGIDSHYHEKIFRIFQRLHTSREYEGTGIGLAIVQKAAQKLGGEVRLESAPETGSTFYVNFPRSSGNQ